MTISVLHVLGGLVAHGAELRVLELIRSSTAEDIVHYVFVLDGSSRDLEEEFQAAGAQVYGARSVKLSGIDLYTTALAMQFDIVHSHVDLLNGWVLSWARLAGVNARISHMRSESVSTRTGLASVFRDGALRSLISRNATHHVGVSPSALAAGFDPRWARSSDSRVILSGIDFRRLQVEPKRLPGEVVLLHIGRDAPVKNREGAVLALNACHKAGIDATLYFVGETSVSREEELQSRNDVDSSKMVFLGVRRDVPALAGGADVVLSTSLAEGMPGSVLESVLVGTRVVASDIPSTRYLADMLDGIHLVRVDGTAEDWSSGIARQLSAGPIRPLPMKHEFVREIFDSLRTVERFESLWREAQSDRN